MPVTPQRKSDPAISYDAYFDEAVSAIEALHGPDNPLRWFHFQILYAAFRWIERKSVHQSDLRKLQKLFAACVDAAESVPVQEPVCIAPEAAAKSPQPQ
jgi:hypothetical protein